MQLEFIVNKPNNNCIKVCSDRAKYKACDIYINNFVDIMNTAISIGSFILKERYSRVITFDIECLHKNFVFAFINRIFQSLYEFNKYKTKVKNEIIIKIYAPQMNGKEKHSIKTLLRYAQYTRDLLNEPANKAMPSSFSQTVVQHFKGIRNIKIKILNSEDIRRQGFGLINAIGSSSSHGARMLVIEYIPKNSRKTFCLVGKGVTMDTGGYSLKDRNHMYNMHMDKTGASICVGLIKYLADISYKNKVVAIMPLVENIVSDISAKPGDVVKAYNGQTVEIVDVDAEGRLILADALTYACKQYSPDYIMDFATLTGWSQMIHCHTSFTYFTLNNKIAKLVEDIGETYAERSFRIPPWTEYSMYLKSDKADVKNFGYNCMNSDGLMASIFLMNFIHPKYRKNWIHFDIKVISGINSLGIADGFATYIDMIMSL